MQSFKKIFRTIHYRTRGKSHIESVIEQLLICADAWKKSSSKAQRQSYHTGK